MERTASDWYEWACRRARASKRRAGDDSSMLPEFAPPVALSDGPLGAVQAADREIARLTAVRARAVVKFAASRPASADRAQGQPGAMSPERWAARPEPLRDVSEWATPEMVVALSISSEAAEAMLTRSLTMVHRLPGTMAALEAGALHPGHLWTMLDKVAPIEDATVRGEVEATLLRWAAGRVTTPAQLGAKARREVARRDARAAARQLENAIRERGVHLRPDATDGMSAVTALLTTPEALLFVRALEACADAQPDDPEDARTRQQKMADCLLDRVLRPGEVDGPSVELMLTVVASVGTLAGGDEPGEIDGHVVPAEMVRELLHRIVGRPPAASATDEPAAVDPLAEAVAGPAVVDPHAAAVTQPAGGKDRSEVEPTCADDLFLSEPDDPDRWWAEMERQVRMEEQRCTPPDRPLGPDAFHPPQDGRGPGPGSRESVPVSHDAVTADGTAVPADGTAVPADGTAVPADDPVVQEDDSGWWASADRAVAEAGLALRESEQAMGRARGLVRTASAADDADEAAWQAGPGGRVTAAEDALAALGECADEQRQWLAELLSTTGGGGLADRPRIALTDALSGTLLALTDLPELCRAGTCGSRSCRRDPARCTHDLAVRPALGPPGPTDGYRPSAALDRWVRARDRRCRFPGCRRRVPRAGELDHDRPYPHGPTSATNLTGYCTGHHRGKHQAPGWRHALAPDGTLTVTTPTGLTAVTTPAPY